MSVDDDVNTTVYTTLTSFFNDLCPQLIAIGVSYDDFWNGNPEIVNYHIEAEEIRVKNEAIGNDTLAWSIGTYVYYAVGALFDEHNKYPTEPQLALSLDKELAQKKHDAEILKMEQDFLAVSRALAARDNLIDEPAN